MIYCELITPKCFIMLVGVSKNIIECIVLTDCAFVIKTNIKIFMNINMPNRVPKLTNYIGITPLQLIVIFLYVVFLAAV